MRKHNDLDRTIARMKGIDANTLFWYDGSFTLVDPITEQPLPSWSEGAADLFRELPSEDQHWLWQNKSVPQEIVAGGRTWWILEPYAICKRWVDWKMAIARNETEIPTNGPTTDTL